MTITRTAVVTTAAEQSLAALIDQIVTTYHVPLREELPRIERLASKAARGHADTLPILVQVEDTVGELSADIGDHIRKEEFIVFPAICAIEEGRDRTGGWIVGPITVMQQEHARAGDLLAGLRRLTGGYALPECACTGVDELYRRLAQLEASMRDYVHVENTVLFPRALARAQAIV